MNQHKLRQLDYIITMALFKWQKKTAGAYEALTSLVSMRRDDYFKAKLVLYFNRLHVKPRLRDIPNQKGSVHCVLSHAKRDTPEECPSIDLTAPSRKKYFQFLRNQMPRCDVFRLRELVQFLHHQTGNTRNYWFCNHPTKNQLQVARQACECRSVLIYPFAIPALAVCENPTIAEAAIYSA